MPEWYLLMAGLAGLGALGFLWRPLYLALPLLAIAVCMLLAQAVVGHGPGGIRVLSPGPRCPRLRAVTAALYVLQPHRAALRPHRIWAHTVAAPWTGRIRVPDSRNAIDLERNLGSRPTPVCARSGGPFEMVEHRSCAVGTTTGGISRSEAVPSACAYQDGGRRARCRSTARTLSDLATSSISRLWCSSRSSRSSLSAQESTGRQAGAALGAIAGGVLIMVLAEAGGSTAAMLKGLGALDPEPCREPQVTCRPGERTPSPSGG